MNSSSSTQQSTEQSSSSIESSSVVESSSSIVESSSIIESSNNEYAISFNTNGGSEITANTTVNGLVVKPADPTKDGFKFEGWFTETGCINEFDFNDAVTAETTLYAKWSRVIPEGYELATYKIDVAELTAATLTEELAIGNFVIANGTTIRTREKVWTDPNDSSNKITFTKSIKLNGSKAGLTVNAPGDGLLVLFIQNGSSGATTQTLVQTYSDGKVVNIEYPGTNESSPVTRIEIEVKAGDSFKLTCGGTTDVYYAEMECVVEVSDETGFSIVNEGVTEYIEGQAYDSSKLQLQVVYGNGRTEVLPITDSNVNIDYSNFSQTTPGTYKISVSYKEYTAQEFDVTVYEFTGIELGFNKTEQIANNSAGNGVYFNQTVQQLYTLNQAFSLDYLTVTLLGTNGESTIEFESTASLVQNDSLESFDNTTAGKYTIEVSYTLNGKTKAATFDVYVSDATPSVVNDIVQIKVDQNYNGIVGEVVDGYNTFVTIQQALDYLEALDDTYSSKQKTIVLASGKYVEKLEVIVPFVSIVGAGTATTTIEWNSLYGIPDESGYSQVTDSCATLAIRDTAIGFNISGVTISNYWNCAKVFDDAFGINYAEHRALAIIIQADQVKIKNCSLLGYQDTIELMTGRQLIEDTYIAGTTDFIFGTNNTTYFKNCEIHSIATGKTKDGAEVTDGGYITAFKGCNKGANDYVQYGAIFDGCNFTADANVLANANTAIGRCWGAYAAVMIMNSELGAHISKTPYSDANNKNVRYIAMNAKPTA